MRTYLFILVLLLLSTSVTAHEATGGITFMPAEPALVEDLGATRVAALQRAGLPDKMAWDDLTIPLQLDRRDGRGERVTGTGSCLVILWHFSDHAADEVAHPASAYDDLMFSAGTHPTGSMHDFYQEASFAAYGVSGDAIGWTTATNSYASYANGDGSQDAGTARNMLIDAIAQLDPVLDFSQYDNDGPDGIPSSGDDDGLVDALFFVHAGPGQESSGDPVDIWSHAWALWGGAGATNDGVEVYRYSVEPEETTGGDLMTLGVFAHEYGHVIGLPDLYDTDYSSSGIGEYGLMSGGSWNHRPGDLPGSCPAQLSAWCKWILGWLDPITLTADQAGLTLPPAATNAAAYRVWRAGNPSGDEFYLLENRQNIGFDAGLVRRQVASGQDLSHGLVIYHVDNSMGSNANDARRLVDVVDASPWFHPDGTWHETHDGQPDYSQWLLLSGYTRGDNGDAWPGFTAFNSDSTAWVGDRDRVRFADDTAPAAGDQDCMATGVEISGISELGSDIVFDLTLHPDISFEPYTGKYSWDFESGAPGWEFCRSRAQRTSDQNEGCPGDAGIWFGQTGWDHCSGIGYGNNWNESVWITAAVNGDEPVLLQLEHRFEVEPDYDFCYVEVRPAIASAPWFTLETFTGVVSCRNDEWTIPQWIIDAAPLVGGQRSLIQLRLRLQSDSGWSSEDGEWCGLGWWLDSVEVVQTATAVDELPGAASDLAILAPPTPNPFNPLTTLRYHVPSSARAVTLEVFDQRGRVVRSLLTDHPGHGWQQVVWDGRDQTGRRSASGQYFARLVVDEAVEVQKMVLLK